MNVAGVPAISHILRRLVGAGLPVYIATPHGLSNRYDSAITDAVIRGLDVRIHEGQDDSPLHRMAEVMKKVDATYCVRITHDDIIIDQRSMLDMIDLAEKEKLGYVSSPKIVDGAGVEVIHRDNLITAASRNGPTEFVSYFVKDQPHPSKTYTPRPAVCRPYRMTMDYPEDHQVLDIVLRVLGSNADAEKVCRFLDDHPYVVGHNATPMLSIYTCAYNAQKYVEKTIDSVIHLRYSDFEYIFVDDASTDSTPVIATKCSRVLPRFKLILNESNLGLATSSNVAIRAARGKYVMRLDADDVLMPYSMNRLIDRIENLKAAAVYPAYYEMDETGFRSEKRCDPAEHHHVGGTIMNTRFINELRFRDGLKHWDSLELYTRLKERFSIAYLDDPTWVYRRHADSLSLNNLSERNQLRQEIAP